MVNSLGKDLKKIIISSIMSSNMQIAKQMEYFKIPESF